MRLGSSPLWGGEGAVGVRLEAGDKVTGVEQSISTRESGWELGESLDA